MSAFDPEKELDELGIPVQYLNLRDVLAAWDAEHGKVYCSIGLSPVLKRCALSHELAHIKLDHRRCAFSDDAVTSISAINQERSAEMWASRQLISAVQLAVARESGLPVLAVSKELGVTDRMYRARLLAEKQDEMRWLGAEGYGSWGCSTELVPS